MVLSVERDDISFLDAPRSGTGGGDGPAIAPPVVGFLRQSR